MIIYNMKTKLTILFILLSFIGYGQISSARKLLLTQSGINVNYGYLYNWGAATDTREITSDANWIIPTQSSYETLFTYLGGVGVSGGKLKEVGLTHWITPNTGATDEVGFKGRPAGYRLADGSFYGIGEYVGFVTSTEGTLGNYWGFDLSFDGTGVPAYNHDKDSGCSIRLLRTTTTLSNGQTGTYTGNDGKVYGTICINGVEYLADNLCETKYRNGSYITGYWAYDDDETNAITP